MLQVQLVAKALAAKVLPLASTMVLALELVLASTMLHRAALVPEHWRVHWRVALAETFLHLVVARVAKTSLVSSAEVPVAASRTALEVVDIGAELEAAKTGWSAARIDRNTAQSGELLASTVQEDMLVPEQAKGD